MTILASFSTKADKITAPGAIIVHDEGTLPHPFVTHWANENGARSGGHYFATETEARADFIARVTRELKYF